MTQPSDRTPKTGSEDLARVIRERREELGLTRQELADAAGIPYPTIAQIETAYRGVSPARLGVIARVLGLDPKELYEVLTSEEPDAAQDVAAPSPPAPSPAAPPLAAPPPSAAQHSARRDVRRSAPSDTAARWHANPRFAAAMPSAMAAGPARDKGSGDRTHEVVEQVVAQLSTLPADHRLDALGEVQKLVLERLVEDRLERGR